ncbi:MAG TPA: energy-coupling factor transporter transmembrane component T [Clostridia bacterium]|nr:energy-coupling factor transporter transmembrane component T [Clostridia bacterium]
MDLQNNSIQKYHPLTMLIYFSAELLIVMFSANPILTATALVAGMAFYSDLKGAKVFLKEFIIILPIFILIAVTNPIFSRDGSTLVFSVLGLSVYYESILYGAQIAGMLIAVIFWFRCLSELLTTDKSLFLFGRFFSKLSLMLTLSLRYIKLFAEQSKRIRNAQKTMGMFSSQSYVDKAKSTMRILSSLITWALESSIDTSNSMKARGYGLKGRKSYDTYRFSKKDYIAISFSVLFAFLTVFGIGRGALAFDFYPSISYKAFSPLSIAAYASFIVLSFMPLFCKAKESIKWKFFMLKI